MPPRSSVEEMVAAVVGVPSFSSPSKMATSTPEPPAAVPAAVPAAAPLPPAEAEADDRDAEASVAEETEAEAEAQAEAEAEAEANAHMQRGEEEGRDAQDSSVWSRATLRDSPLSSPRMQLPPELEALAEQATAAAAAAAVSDALLLNASDSDDEHEDDTGEGSMHNTNDTSDEQATPVRGRPSSSVRIDADRI
jgi:hypothetical protein